MNVLVARGRDTDLNDPSHVGVIDTTSGNIRSDQDRWLVVSSESIGSTGSLVLIETRVNFVDRCSFGKGSHQLPDKSSGKHGELCGVQKDNDL